jgi:carboxylesterase type B
LNVNVVRPQGIDHNAKLPVLEWIYGGGYNQGSNRDSEFNTSFLLHASLDIGHPVVIVSINYRLGGFGFLAGAQVQAQGVTNLGLRDQWKALEWIQENIGAFGGDPKKVTIWVRFLVV